MFVRNSYINDYAVDAQWFLALKDIKRPLLLHSLAIDSVVLEQEKEKVFATVDYNPTFIYPQLDANKINIARDELVKLRAEVCQKETDSSILSLYREKLSECILEQELLLASVENRHADFEVLNLQLYGNLNSQYIAENVAVLQNRYHLFKNFLEDTHDILPKPTQNDFEQAKGLVTGPDIGAFLGTLLTSEELVDTWNKEIEKSLPDWKAVVDPSVVYMLVDHKRRKIRIPKGVKVKPNKMRKLFVHEIGTHVFRREQGRHSRLQLASIGLASYQPAEEGLAIMRAQLVSKRFYNYGGLDKYLTLALATGELDGIPKNFSETFSLLRDYYSARLERTLKSHLITRLAPERAWNSTLRVFRGGNPSLPGSCFMRDKIYHEGNRAMWSMVRTHPEYFLYVMEGKFDPENKIQRDAIERFRL